MRRSGCGRPSVGAHRPVEPRAGLDRRRPGALVQPAQHQQVGALQARLQRPPDGEPRMAAEARADRSRARAWWRAAPAIRRRRWRPCPSRPRAGAPARRPAPRRHRRDHSASAEATRLGGGDGGVEQGVRRGAGLHQRRQRRCRGLHPVDQLVHGAAGPSGRRSAPCRCGRGSPPGPAWASARAGTCDRAGARRRARRRGRRPACTADASAGRAGRPGAKPLVDDADQRLQQAGGRRVAERRAGRIVDVDVPAPELGGDAAREVAVGRHQGGGACAASSRLSAQRQAR